MFWAVMCLQKEISLNGVGIPLDKEDGFEGYIPVFKTKPAALKHTGGKFFIIPMALGKEKITRRKK